MEDGRTDGRTDGWTDELIRVGLGNQRFLQVNMVDAPGGCMQLPGATSRLSDVGPPPARLRYLLLAALSS